jgi:hypothetical protein
MFIFAGKSTHVFSTSMIHEKAMHSTYSREKTPAGNTKSGTMTSTNSTKPQLTYTMYLFGKTSMPCGLL